MLRGPVYSNRTDKRIQSEGQFFCHTSLTWYSKLYHLYSIHLSRNIVCGKSNMEESSATLKREQSGDRCGVAWHLVAGQSQERPFLTVTAPAISLYSSRGLQHDQSFSCRPKIAARMP